MIGSRGPFATDTGLPGRRQRHRRRTALKKLRISEALTMIETAPSPSSKPSAKNSLDKLMDEVDREADPQGKLGSGGRSQIDKGGKGASDQANAQKPIDEKTKSASSHAGVGDNAASAGGLWGQIEPCWRKLPGLSAAPVTLEVTLNEKGLIALPPKIFRPNTAAPNESRLLAEARAISAVTACVPYHGSLLGSDQRKFRVDFRTSH